jgi:hypothetical protein
MPLYSEGLPAPNVSAHPGVPWARKSCPYPPVVSALWHQKRDLGCQALLKLFGLNPGEISPVVA